MIAGGGIGDGAIDGVVNLYVIDDAARTPIDGAEVRVGTISGTTDADGLFVAEGLVGAQDVVVKAPGHRKELWLGVNGANVTIDLEKDLDPTPPSHTFTGAITGFDTVAFTPQANHFKVGVVSYSQTDDLGDADNNIKTPNDGNVCFSQTGTDACNFTVDTRTGKLALFAMIIDLDTKGTADGSDDTTTLLGYAIKQGIDTASASAVQNLSVIPSTDQQIVSIDLGSAPSGLTQRAGLVQVELGDEGQLSVATAVSSAKVPKTSALSGATGYTLVGFATDGAATNPAESITLSRGLTGTSLSAGAYLTPPTAINLTRTSASWTNASGATVHSVELSQGATKIMNVTVFDSARSSFDFPDLIALPSGPITAKVGAIGATGFDVTNFALDDDLVKLDRIADQQTTIN